MSAPPSSHVFETTATVDRSAGQPASAAAVPAAKSSSAVKSKGKAATSLDYCAIDFGTSNSAVAIPVEAPVGDASSPTMQLVQMEGAHATMPTAVFYFTDGPEHDGPPRAFGRAAMAAYVEGLDGRLMRSMKSVLGSNLIEQSTDVGGGRGVKFIDVIAGYLRHLKRLAEAQAQRPIDRAVIGRPVFFVDDDPVRDARAQAALEEAARSVGFADVRFQYEPIAAAFDYERLAPTEQIVLVADIGGGTSDFSVVRVGPQRVSRLDRRDDILASHGVHAAGTDFDRQIELAGLLPEIGFGSRGPMVPGGSAREVPSAVYYDLATWHLINTVYTPQRVADLRSMRSFYGTALYHRRLMTVVTERLGHELAALAEKAKIETAEGGGAAIDLGLVEPQLTVMLTEKQAADSVEADVTRIVNAARVTVRDAGLRADQIDALYFTGGSTGLRSLTDRIGQAFPAATVARGDRFASVASGLGLYAAQLFGRRKG
ncbi:MAG: heat-shock protein [Rhizobacter sp.]|nr:heat-shock protein [Rhizobacter sp.]